MNINYRRLLGHTFTCASKMIVLGAISVVILSSPLYGATVAITEWMYSPSGGPGEYFELTNVSGVPIDMTGWSEDDNNRRPGDHPLGAFGIIQPGESVIGTETDADSFRTYWNLPASVKVVGYGSQDNIGRSDEINIYDSGNNLVDRLTYNDQVIGGPRTQGTSANITPANLTQNLANLAVTSAVGDVYGSYRGGGGFGDLGNPGRYTSVPEPSTLLLGSLCGFGLLAAKFMAKRYEG